MKKDLIALIILSIILILLAIELKAAGKKDIEIFKKRPDVIKCNKLNGSLIRSYSGELICIKDLLKEEVYE